MQAEPDRLRPVPPDAGNWQPRFRVNQAEIVEMPEVRARRERFQSGLDRAIDREALRGVTVSERAREASARLCDPSFEAREAAVRALLDPSVSDDEVLALLVRDALDDEGHARLLSVAVRRVIEKPRGALGVRMGNGPATRPGVVVQSTLPGMPAEKVLRAGDLIEQVDGRALQDSTDLVSALQSLPPGTEVALLVLRPERDPQGRPILGPDGKPVERRMEFRVPLGNANDLDRLEPGVPRGMGAGMNLVNEERRLRAEFIRQRFARPLPVAVRPEPAVPAGAAP